MILSSLMIIFIRCDGISILEIVWNQIEPEERNNIRESLNKLNTSALFRDETFAAEFSPTRAIESITRVS